MAIVLVLLALIVVVLGYVRLAPTVPQDWHGLPEFDGNRDAAGAAFRVIDNVPEGLARLAVVADGWERTERVAGTPGEGMITWVTRSRVIGFPDYTTAIQEGDRLRVFGRLRFGRNDFGVNARRLDSWISAAGL